MKKYFETTPNFDGLKERIIILKDGEDKKTLFAVIALVVAVVVAVTVGVVYLLKTKMDDEYEEDWDYDWDDLDDEFCCEDDDCCCCTDKKPCKTGVGFIYCNFLGYCCCMCPYWSCNPSAYRQTQLGPHRPDKCRCDP